MSFSYIFVPALNAVKQSVILMSNKPEPEYRNKLVIILLPEKISTVIR